MAGGTVRSQADRAAPPVRSCFPTVTADIAAGTIQIVGSDTVTGVVISGEGQVDGTVMTRSVVTDLAISAD